METEEREEGAETGLCLLQKEQPFLLELFLRIPDLSGMHAGESLGNDV
jgi:hypothetical protein